MSRITSVIPAKPRSDRFKYYDTGTSSVSGGGVIVQPAAPDSEQEIAYIDTYDNIPTPPENGLKLVITQDTHEIYSWDEDNEEWVNTTPQSGVTKIVAGTNITITPATGVGEVTVNSTGGGSGGGSQSANTVGYYTVAVPSGTRLQDTVASVINIASGLPSGAAIIGATYLIPSAWTFPVAMELSSDLTRAFLYCTLESDRSTPSTSYILVQYQKAITFGTSLKAGTNVSITGDGSTATPYTINSTGGGVTLATSGTGNSVSGLSLSGSTLTQTLGYKLNSVTESSDGSQGFYYLSANEPPQYSNGVLNLPYKQLFAGPGITIENGKSPAANIVIISALSKSIYEIPVNTVITDAGILMVDKITEGSAISPPMWNIATGTEFPQPITPPNLAFFLRWSASDGYYQLRARCIGGTYTTTGKWYLTVIN
jgi:hypothetical protein